MGVFGLPFFGVTPSSVPGWRTLSLFLFPTLVLMSSFSFHNPVYDLIFMEKCLKIITNLFDYLYFVFFNVDHELFIIIIIKLIK